jgi:hypothetical protein
MSKITNSAMLLDIENFLKQRIAAHISTCPSRIKILSIGCIDQQWSEQVDEFGFSTNEDDENPIYMQHAIRKVEWYLNYFDGSGMVKGKVYTAELLSQWTENIHDSQDYVGMSLGKADAETLMQELTVLAEVNLEAAKKNLF